MKPSLLVFFGPLLFSAAIVAAADNPRPGPPLDLPSTQGEVLELAPPPRKVPITLTQPHVGELRRQVDELRNARDALRSAMNPLKDVDAPRDVLRSDDELVRLRDRLHLLLTEIAARPTKRPPPPIESAGPDVGIPPPPMPRAEPQPETRPSDRPNTTKSDGEATQPSRPLDAFALGNSLFSLGDYESALKAYRQINLSSLQIDELGPVRYLIATCLRRLGKTDEAANLYRELASSRGDEFFADCAQWQLAAMRWRQDIDIRIQEIRRKRQAVEGKP